MLRQVVYRSRASSLVNNTLLEEVARDSLPFNAGNDVTGILLFDGEYFFQVLEGEGDIILGLFEHIKNDPRHNNVVKITDNAIHKRDFGDWALRTLRLDQKSGCYWLPSDISFHRDSRIFALINGFASGKWRMCLSSQDLSDVKAAVNQPELTTPAYENSSIQFAFQPIVDTYRGCVSSYEALLRSSDGRFPEDVLDSFEGNAKYEFDLKSKAIAIAQGAKLLTEDQALSVNLCPGAITYSPDIASYLLTLAAANNLKPQQLILEVTETEIIKEGSAFFDAIENLRSTGIRVALDDFGAGYAGLSLLADFLPDKIKLDRKITTSIHDNGPRQAIFEAVYEFANSMGIPLIVEGVETMDEWLWLQHAGAQRFQGYLFARPKLNGVEAINFVVNGVKTTVPNLILV
ncbi:diguanylate phosphodiesterase [Alteromonas sp. A081]|uniref:diguanylate phosphodiesterase n=1 Tax=Alteromonas sp. A081 TaxID=3410269 RepID=UPI003B9879DB